MAICTRCQQEMSDELGCTWRPIVVIDPFARPGSEGSLYQRIPYRARRKGETCGDCRTPGGKLPIPDATTSAAPRAGDKPSRAAAGGKAIPRWSPRIPKRLMSSLAE